MWCVMTDQRERERERKRERFMTTTALALALAALTACGPGAAGRPGAAVKAPRQPVKRDALREFDAGLRAVRLGGPEAFERAAERFENAVEIDPSLWEAWYNLGVVYAREGDDGAALDAFEAALERNPQHTAARLAHAESARKIGRAGQARKDYEAVLAHYKDDEDDVATRLRLASLLRESGDLDGCLKAVRAALRKSGSDPRAYVELGLLHLAAGRDELAELVLRKAGEMDPRNPLAVNALALVELKRGRDQEAFLLFDQASSLDPQFKDARFNKAGVLMDAGDYKRAAAELESVLAADPEDQDARIALGVAYRGLGEYDKAAASWETVLKSAPRQPDAVWNLAVLEMDFRKRPEAAKDRLAQYLQVAPEDHPKRKDAKAREAELRSEK
jgi:tetratricopeptide (TPR) repeat protein